MEYLPTLSSILSFWNELRRYQSQTSYHFVAKHPDLQLFFRNLRTADIRFLLRIWLLVEIIWSHQNTNTPCIKHIDSHSHSNKIHTHIHLPNNLFCKPYLQNWSQCQNCGQLLNDNRLTTIMSFQTFHNCAYICLYRCVGVGEYMCPFCFAIFMFDISSYSWLTNTLGQWKGKHVKCYWCWWWW